MSLWPHWNCGTRHLEKPRIVPIPGLISSSGNRNPDFQRNMHPAKLANNSNRKNLDYSAFGKIVFILSQYKFTFTYSGYNGRYCPQNAIILPIRIQLVLQI